MSKSIVPSFFDDKLIHSLIIVRMGYHKDPDHFKSISPYGIIALIQLCTFKGLTMIEGELRRRLWAMICHLGFVLPFVRPIMP